MSALLRIVGDVHGKIDWNVLQRKSYLDVIESCKFSVQVGDMGDSESYAILRDQVNAAKHRFVPGNHDDYDNLPEHSLGDFGTYCLGDCEFFYLRGGFSVDKALRVKKGIPWWPQEEMDETVMDAAREAYSRSVPSIVVTHTCPYHVAGLVGNPRDLERYGFDPSTFETRTQRFLQQLFESHRPKLWVFGHYHRNWEYTLGGTRFRCLDELCYVDVNAEGEIVRP